MHRVRRYALLKNIHVYIIFLFRGTRFIQYACQLHNAEFIPVLTFESVNI